MTDLNKVRDELAEGSRAKFKVHPRYKQLAVGASIYSTLIKGDDGKKYWHCNRCNVEVEHKQRCRCCGKSIREKK